MNVYVAVVESDKRPGRCVKLVLHVPDAEGGRGHGARAAAEVVVAELESQAGEGVRVVSG